MDKDQQHFDQNPIDPAHATPSGVATLLVLAVFGCIAIILIYAAHSGRKQLESAHLTEQAQRQIDRGQATRTVPDEVKKAMESIPDAR